jgi:hypothetical protein
MMPIFYCVSFEKVLRSLLIKYQYHLVELVFFVLYVLNISWFYTEKAHLLCANGLYEVGCYNADLP